MGEAEARTCAECGGAIIGKRSDAKFCGEKCRAYAHNHSPKRALRQHRYRISQKGRENQRRYIKRDPEKAKLLGRARQIKHYYKDRAKSCANARILNRKYYAQDPVKFIERTRSRNGRADVKMLATLRRKLPDRRLANRLYMQRKGDVTLRQFTEMVR